MKTGVQDPLNLLLRLQRTSREAEPALPEQVDAKPRWRGLGFGLGGLNLVCPLEQVRDVVVTELVTPVPRTKSWVRGISNVRGNLLTVIDLAHYLGRTPQHQEVEAPVLVMESKELQCALLVSSVFGLRHFDEEHESQHISVLDSSVQPYVDKAFLHEGRLWGVFNIQSLALDEGFRRIAA